MVTIKLLVLDQASIHWTRANLHQWQHSSVTESTRTISFHKCIIYSGKCL